MSHSLDFLIKKSTSGDYEAINCLCYELLHLNKFSTHFYENVVPHTNISLNVPEYLYSTQNSNLLLSIIKHIDATPALSELFDRNLEHLLLNLSAQHADASMLQYLLNSNTQRTSNIRNSFFTAVINPTAYTLETTPLIVWLSTKNGLNQYGSTFNNKTFHSLLNVLSAELPKISTPESYKTIFLIWSYGRSRPGVFEWCKKSLNSLRQSLDPAYLFTPDFSKNEHLNLFHNLPVNYPNIAFNEFSELFQLICTSNQSQSSAISYPLEIIVNDLHSSLATIYRSRMSITGATPFLNKFSKAVSRIDYLANSWDGLHSLLTSRDANSVISSAIDLTKQLLNNPRLDYSSDLCSSLFSVTSEIGRLFSQLGPLHQLASSYTLDYLKILEQNNSSVARLILSANFSSKEPSHSKPVSAL